MIIIDLRPYEKHPPAKPLAQVLDEHLKSIRGIGQVIYSVVDTVYMTEKQFESLKDSDVPRNCKVEVFDADD